MLLKHADGKSGVGMRFNRCELPCFTQWKNLVPLPDGYVSGLEPGTNFPNTRSAEAKRGRIVRLEPSATWQAAVSLDWHLGQEEVVAAEQAIAQLQAQGWKHLPVEPPEAEPEP